MTSSLGLVEEHYGKKRKADAGGLVFVNKVWWAAYNKGKIASGRKRKKLRKVGNANKDNTNLG